MAVILLASRYSKMLIWVVWPVAKVDHLAKSVNTRFRGWDSKEDLAHSPRTRGEQQITQNCSIIGSLA